MPSSKKWKVPEADVRLRAYLIWERNGCPTGRDLDYWLRAERELRSEVRHPKPCADRKAGAITVAMLPGLSRTVTAAILGEGIISAKQSTATRRE